MTVIEHGLPIIAIGASAGGLEPIEDFFKGLRGRPGWCFVVLQHLSPDYVSRMDDLLARQTDLPIRKITHGMKLAPDTIYLNAPSCYVRVVEDHFEVTPYLQDDALPRLPIDAFFQSLARLDVPERVGIVLSGSGADGSRGAVALSKSGGRIIVQPPKDAAFSSMPRATLATTPVDKVLAPDLMVEAIETIFLSSALEPGAVEIKDPSVAILRLLETRYQIDFDQYKQATVLRRILRRQQLRGHANLQAFLAELHQAPELLDELYSDLLIGVTQFYRDPECWSHLRRLALPALLKRANTKQTLRVWVPACASGEEAYTIAMEIEEAMAELDLSVDYRVIASDVHPHSIKVATAGFYPTEALESLPDELRDKYFVRADGGYTVAVMLRRRLVFSAHNVLSDPPFMNIDLISCRNMMIYVTDEAQRSMLSRFIFSLKTEGFLLLGPSETLGRLADHFVDVNARWRLFRKSSHERIVGKELFAQSHKPDIGRPEMSQVRVAARRPLHLVGDREGGLKRETLIDGYDALLKRYAPSSIMLSTDGDVLTWFGIASAFIDTKSNMAEWRVEQILKPELRYPVLQMLERIRQGTTEPDVRMIRLSIGEGNEIRNVRVAAERLSGGYDRRLVLLTFKEMDGAPEPAPGPLEASPIVEGASDLAQARVLELERDLRLTEESLQFVTESLEASGEELQASNEELQASNEELQASNEELQSANEELHAVNEEMISVTNEHQLQISITTFEKTAAHRALTDAGIGMLMLDGNGTIVSFSPLTRRALALESFDVGRSVANVGVRLEGLDLTQLAQDVCRTGKTLKQTGAFKGRSVTVIGNRRRFHGTRSDEYAMLILSGELVADAAAVGQDGS